MNNFLKAYYDKICTFCTCSDSFYNFFSYLNEKIQLKVLASSNEILKILPVTRFKDPQAAILTLKMLTGSRL
jgi:hypothetical protein